jgi:hypothetical protein
MNSETNNRSQMKAAEAGKGHVHSMKQRPKMSWEDHRERRKENLSTFGSYGTK